jgi:hypothetical protein
MKAWSISTTIRNPERIPDFMQAVQPIVGSSWRSKDTQIEYFANQIAIRIYKPTESNLSAKSIQLLNDDDAEISLARAYEIIEEKNYTDVHMRGRTSMSPLVDNGLVTTFDTVKLTSLGRALLDGQIPFNEVMMNFAFKWQVPQPNHSKFKSENGYSIRPFIGTLALIKKVNQLWESAGNDRKGISWDEFCIYGPTLTDSSDIDKWAKEIIAIRKAVLAASGNAAKDSVWKNGVNRFLEPLLEGKERISDPKVIANLYDYGDNAFRYFKQSKFFSLRGGGRYIDISPLSEAQVDMLITDEQYKPLYFATPQEYADFMQDLNSFVPPWTTPEKKKTIENKLREILREKGAEAKTASKIKAQSSLPSALREDETISELREAITEVNMQYMTSDAATVEFLSSCVEDYLRLARRQDIPEAEITRIKAPTQLEYVTFKTFLSINDLVQIKPNYPVDDEGNPTFTAGGNLPDLEIFYKDFNAICEVTLMTNRAQWMAESQPVQRHLHDFVVKNSDKEAFGIFIAPSIHRDTKNSFKQAFHTGVDSLDSLKIVPFDFVTWTATVGHLAEARKRKKNITQSQFQAYLESLLPSTTKKENTDEWWERISNPANILEFIK